MRHHQSDYSDYSTFTVVRAGGVATLTLDRPESLNAVGAEMHRELSHVFYQLADDKDVSVVVLTGSGKAFSAGGDIAWMEEMTQSLPFHLDSLREAHRIIMGILDCPKPVVCRMNGDAIGLGASMALVCDMIIAVETARIADPHVKIGLVAGDGGALIWPQLIGYAKAKEFLLTGSAVGAVEAARMGLINQAVKADELDTAVQRHVGKLLAVSSAAASYTKLAVNLPLRQAMHSVFDVSSAYEGLSMLQNADWKEGIAAFKEGRPPRYNRS